MNAAPSLNYFVRVQVETDTSQPGVPACTTATIINTSKYTTNS